MSKDKARSDKSKKAVVPRAEQESGASTPPRPGLGSLFPVVGIGASAGGLEAFTELLRHLPAGSGMALVLVQHLDRTHASFLSEALARATTMIVTQVENGMRLEPDRVYVIPPNADMVISHDVLTLRPRESGTAKPHLPIDLFFRSLAAERRSQAIGVILSGTASDGTEGFKAIKAEGGITFVQDPSSARFDGMPHSAIDAGVADYSLPLPRLAEELVRVCRHPYLAVRDEAPPGYEDGEALQEIFALVRNVVGVGFDEYKAATFQRRLARRMALCGLRNVQEYLKLLHENPVEVRALYEDILVHVTSFFRDEEVFEGLKKQVFPEILKHKAKGAPVRLWAAGCSTGEEVYSLAIALLEFLGGSSRSNTIQIFGSDLSQRRIEKARAGVFPDSAIRDLSEERRRRYFTKLERGYRIKKDVRELCVFVRHDLARDPPFSKMDLVSCRNVLIYFGEALQKRVLASIHYSLNQPGFLLLGHTESVSGLSQFFSVVDKAAKVFERSATHSTLRFAPGPEVQSGAREPADRGSTGFLWPRLDMTKHVERLLISRYIPPGVIVDEKLEILQFYGRTGPYLEPAPGEPRQNILKMARQGLLPTLRLALAQAKLKWAVVRKEGVLVRQNGSTRTCDVVILPIARPGSEERLHMVLFEEVAPTPGKWAKHGRRTRKAQSRKETARASKLEHELAATKEYLLSLVEEHDRTNDELASANEELVSSNEELQSTNEELETAKEEIQSANEELTTVNDELHNRNQELNQANNDLLNVLGTVDVPIIILDQNRCIRRFTPKARTIANVVPGDVGRPIDDIKLNILMTDLDHKIAEAIGSDTTKEAEVQDREGRWHRMEIRPYKTADDRIEGAVLSFIDIDVLKRAVGVAEWARDYAAGIVEAVPVPLIVLDDDLRAISANEAFYQDFGVTAAETERKTFFELEGGAWNIQELRGSLEEVLAKNTRLQGLDLEGEFPSVGRRTMSLSARSVHSRTGLPMILLAIEDITDRKRGERERAELLTKALRAEEAEHANQAKDQFLATLSHELRTPLSSMLIHAQMLRLGEMDVVKLNRASDAIERSVKMQALLIDDLLDVSRITNGKFKIEFGPVDLAAVVRLALEAVGALAESKSITVEASMAKSIGMMSGDPMRLQQVVENLLTNAIKFTPAGGRVTVALEQVDGSAKLEVSDTGRGIAPEFLPRIFDRFTQEDSSITRPYGGLGLGLAIARHIVELHGGTVSVESSGSGKGAIFTVLLPLMASRRDLVDAQVAPASKPGATVPGPRAASDPSKLSGLRVLVIDDDPGTREAVEQVLDWAGADVRAAASAAEGVAAFGQFRPEIILCDVAMPGEDGYSFVRKMRALSRDQGEEVPAIALTALAGEDDRQRALDAGFQMHLTKPVEIDGLLEAVVELSKRSAPARLANDSGMPQAR